MMPIIKIIQPQITNEKKEKIDYNKNLQYLKCANLSFLHDEIKSFSVILKTKRALKIIRRNQYY